METNVLCFRCRRRLDAIGLCGACEAGIDSPVGGQPIMPFPSPPSPPEQIELPFPNVWMTV